VIETADMVLQVKGVGHLGRVFSPWVSFDVVLLAFMARICRNDQLDKNDNGDNET